MSDATPAAELKLATPVQHGSETIEVLKLRKPLTKDLRPLSAQPTFGDLLSVGARLCDQPDSVIDKLDVGDGIKLVELVGGFFPVPS